MTIKTIALHVNPECKYTDMKSLFDSFRYVLVIKDKTYLDIPLWSISSGWGIGNIADEKNCRSSLGIHLECVSDLMSVLEEQGRPPFTVEGILQLQISFDTNVGVYFQEFLFQPGHTYARQVVTGFPILPSGPLKSPTR